MQYFKSLDYLHHKYNCNNASKIHGKCSYSDHICKKYWIILKVTYQISEAEYIGDIQNYFKTCMECHFSEVQKLLHTGKESNTFADH